MPINLLSWGSFFNFGYLDKSRESPTAYLEIRRSGFGESTEGLSFCVLEDNLITAMGRNCLLGGKLNNFYSLAYWGGQNSWGREYLLFKKRLWEMQDRKMVIKEGLDWWFPDRMSRNVVFTTRFWNFFLSPCVLFVVKFFFALMTLLDGMKRNVCIYI